MSTKVMDEILSRWFRDGQFREQLRHNPEQALAGYDLTREQRVRLFKLKKRVRHNKDKQADFPCSHPNHPFSQN